MTNKEKAVGLMAQVMDRENDDLKRRQDLYALVALKKASKTSYEKLGVSQPMVERELEKLASREAMAADLAKPDPLEEEVAHSIADLPFHIAADAIDAGKPASERGLISAMVRDRLEHSSDGYVQIVEDVRKAFSLAKTTARSVASVAADLRKAGRTVPQRGAK